MLSFEQMDEIGLLEEANAKESRVVTTVYSVSKIKEEILQNEDKLADLMDAVKTFSNAGKDADNSMHKQAGFHIDKEKGIGDIYHFALYASPQAFDRHIGRTFNIYANRILPNVSLEELICTTGEEDLEYWTSNLATWQQEAKIFDVLENINDPEKKPYADPTMATAEELIKMGLPNEMAVLCVDAMMKATYQGDFTPSKHRCVMKVVYKIKDEVFTDEELMAGMKQNLKEYGDYSRTTAGKLACEISISEKYKKIYILEHFNSIEAHLAHIGRTMRFVAESVPYSYCEEYVVSCAKEDEEYFTKNGIGWDAKSKTVVMAYF